MSIRLIKEPRFDGGDDKPVTKCETPTITDADMANDKLSQDGKVVLSAAVERGVVIAKVGKNAIKIAVRK